MKKYYINVWVSVFANSAEEANQEVRVCLNTGRGHIHGYEIAEIKDAKCSKCRDAGWVYGQELDVPCDEELYQWNMTKHPCDWCKVE